MKYIKFSILKKIFKKLQLFVINLINLYENLFFLESRKIKF